jgi:hypothetical protein
MACRSIWARLPPAIPSTYILAVNRKYYTPIFMNTAINTTRFDPQETPSIIVTDEFGGTFADSFVGCSAQCYWQ